MHGFSNPSWCEASPRRGWHRALPWRLWCAPALVLGAVMAATAADVPPLTWDDCVRLARAHSPQRVAAEEAWLAASAGTASAASTYRPQLSGGAGAARGGSTTDGRDSGADDSYSASLDVEQSLYRGGRTRAEVAAARASESRAEAAVAVTDADLTLELRQAYVALLVAQEQVALAARIRDRRADNEALVRLRYESGREHQGSLALSEATRFAAEEDVAQAWRDTAVARERLARAIGLASLDRTTLVVTGALDGVTAPAEVDVGELARRSPDYVQAVASVRAAEADLASAQGGRLPTLAAYGAASRAGDDEAFGDDRWSVGLRLSYPFWSGGREGYNVRAAAARLRQSEAELQVLEDRLVRDLVDARSTLAGAIGSVRTQERFVAAKALRAEIARKQYQSGLLTFENWDIIENDRIQSQNSLLQAWRGAMLAAAGWERAQGASVFGER